MRQKKAISDMLHLRREYKCCRRTREKKPAILCRSSVFTGDLMASFERLKQTRVKLIRYANTRFLLDRHNPCVEQPFFAI